MSTIQRGTTDSLRIAQERIAEAVENGDLDQRRAPLLETLDAYHQCEPVSFSTRPMLRSDVIGVMEREGIDRWLSGYVEAWRTNDRERIAALFSADAKYRYHPYDEWICGREAIVSSWLGESDAEGASAPDQPGTWEAEYRTIAVEGDVAVAVGSTMYSIAPGGPVDRVYDNCFVLRFDAEGRCQEFTEWYVKRPGPA